MISGDIARVALLMLDKRIMNLAIADYDKAIELCPDNEHNYHMRGEIYTNKGDYDLAICRL